MSTDEGEITASWEKSVLMGDYIKHVSFELGFIGKVRE